MSQKQNGVFKVLCKYSKKSEAFSADLLFFFMTLTRITFQGHPQPGRAFPAHTSNSLASACHPVPNASSRILRCLLQPHPYGQRTFPFVFHLVCCNEMPRTEGLTHNKHLFVTLLETGKSRPKALQILCLERGFWFTSLCLLTVVEEGEGVTGFIL